MSDRDGLADFHKANQPPDSGLFHSKTFPIVSITLCSENNRFEHLYFAREPLLYFVRNIISQQHRAAGNTTQILNRLDYLSVDCCWTANEHDAIPIL